MATPCISLALVRRYLSTKDWPQAHWPAFWTLLALKVRRDASVSAYPSTWCARGEFPGSARSWQSMDATWTLEQTLCESGQTHRWMASCTSNEWTYRWRAYTGYTVWWDFYLPGWYTDCRQIVMLSFILCNEKTGKELKWLKINPL